MADGAPGFVEPADLAGLRERLRAGDQDGVVAEIVAALLRAGYGRTSRREPSFFVTGESRSGKSLVAASLAQEGFEVLCLDHLRAARFTGHEPGHKPGHAQDRGTGRAGGALPPRWPFRARLYDAILDRFPRGLVLEGAEAWLHIRNRPAAAIAALEARGTAMVFLGCSPEHEASRAAQLMRSARDGHCRAPRSQAWCAERARGLVTATARMAALAARWRGGHLFTLAGADIEQEARQVSAAILARLAAPGQGRDGGLGGGLGGANRTGGQLG